MVQHQVATRYGAVWFSLQISPRHVIPLGQKGLHLVHALLGGGAGDGARVARAGNGTAAKNVRKAREHLAEVADEGLDGVEEESELLGREAALTLAAGEVVMEEVLEQIAEGGRHGGGFEELGVHVGSGAVRRLHLVEPFSGCLALPEGLRAGERTFEFGDGKKGRDVVEEGELLIEHDVVVNQPVPSFSFFPMVPFQLKVAGLVEHRNHGRL